MTLQPTTFRPESEEQERRLAMVAFLLGLSISATLRLAVDELCQKRSSELLAIEDSYETARAAMDEARQVAKALRE
jgi:hypothetical protein